MGRMGPGLTSMAMCSCMLTRGRRRLLAAAAPAMGAQTCGGGSEKAPQTGDEGAAPNELGRGGITEGSEGVLGGSRDLRTEHGEGVGGGERRGGLWPGGGPGEQAGGAASRATYCSESSAWFGLLPAVCLAEVTCESKSVTNALLVSRGRGKRRGSEPTSRAQEVAPPWPPPQGSLP